MRKVIVAIVALISVSSTGCERAGNAEGGTQATQPNAVKVEFYVMSQCPYGVRAEESVKPALEALGGYVDFNLDYIVTPQGEGKFRSLHGETEVQGDIVQLCAKKVSPDSYLDFISCQNKNPRDIPNNWKECAEQAGIDAAALEECKEGPEGVALLTASAKRSTDRGARGSPTIYVAGKPYRGGRRSNDFVRAFCEEIQGEQPQACKDIPPPPKVALRVLTDGRCTDRACQSVAGLTERLKGAFPGLEVTELDYATDEGKALYEEADLEYLPAFLFDETVNNDKEGLGMIQRYLVPAGKYRSLRVGGKFDPTAEICDNHKDDTCREKLICREEKKQRLDLFVMSQCPYGVKALNSMPEVLENFEGNIDFHVNYIADQTGDTFSSLHGPPEVEEDIRELCAIEHYPDGYKFMDYILCRNKDIRSPDWKSCAVSGIDAAVIEECASGEEGKRLLAENIKLGKTLGVGGSPTWIANNRHQFSALDAETVRRNFCEHNPDTANCDKHLSTAQRVEAGACTR